ncbi:hypothetical protein BIV25_38395 [Streptomyces sp. MUSC 14]|uniref:putative T7SS-secreted protein n=1 Tax=Streptomyces sp. MUSC 14 TaxID=1354889 RepID=UPI0008F5B3AB|nr:hypothetical protein [Streptomyces sp. MUSC 14]OIJ87562.1 hypothetical protein BIV25_38395 [Streptomyces sp. MUSC 14]
MSGRSRPKGEILSGGKILYDHAKRETGHLVGEGADLTGDALDKVGAYSVAQVVRHGGDQAVPACR